jgi:hypothetical protein
MSSLSASFRSRLFLHQYGALNAWRTGMGLAGKGLARKASDARLEAYVAVFLSLFSVFPAF